MLKSNAVVENKLCNLFIKDIQWNVIQR